MANTDSVYKAKKAASLSNPTSASTFVQSDNSALAAVVYFPVLGSDVKSAAYKFRAVGRASTVGSHNVTPKVSFGASATAGSNTVIAAGAAQACATTTAAWVIEGTLYWDSTSQALKGNFWGENGSTAVFTAIAATTTKTGVDMTVSGNALSVECTIPTGGGDLAFLDDFTLEAL